jgi:hypothetical protein
LAFNAEKITDGQICGLLKLQTRSNGSNRRGGIFVSKIVRRAGRAVTKVMPEVKVPTIYAATGKSVKPNAIELRAQTSLLQSKDFTIKSLAQIFKRSMMTTYLVPSVQQCITDAPMFSTDFICRLRGEGCAEVSMKIYLDCETLPPDKNDPLVSERVAQLSEEEYRKLALNSQWCRLLCIGLIVENDNGEIIHRGVLGRNRNTMQFHLDERRLLRSFWNLLKGFDVRKDLLIGFNLLDYDLVIILQHSILKKVKPTFDISFARFRSRPVFDVMWEFQVWRHRISLDELAKVMGVQSSKQNGVDGSKVYDLFLEGHHQEICDYCLADCDLTRLLYYRINFIDEDKRDKNP